jgi:hypothetical protein
MAAKSNDGKIDCWQLLVARERQEKCRANSRTKTSKTPKTPQKDVLIVVSWRTITATKIGSGVLENKFMEPTPCAKSAKFKSKTATTKAKNYTNIHMNAIENTYLKESIITMEASTSLRRICCTSKYGKNSSNIVDSKNKIVSIRREKTTYG